MSDHKLRHDVTVKATAGDVKILLTKRDGLAKWMRGAVTDNAAGDGWTVSYPGGPEFEWRLARNDAETISWTCVAGPGDAAGTSVTFQLKARGDGRLDIHFTHAGWPHQEGNFAKCNALWGMLLHHLREAADHGKSAAHLS